MRRKAWMSCMKRLRSSSCGGRGLKSAVAESRMTTCDPCCLLMAWTRCTRPEMSYSPLTTIGPSICREASVTRSIPLAMAPLRSRPRLSPVEMRSSADSSTAMSRVLMPLRAVWEAIWRPRIVLPVPLRPTMRLDRPFGMPPWLMTSNPGTPVGIFSTTLIRTSPFRRDRASRPRLRCPPDLPRACRGPANDARSTWA